MSRGVGDCNPLEKYRVSASFGFLRIFQDAEQQDLQAVDFILDVWNTVEDGERLPHIFTE